MNLHIAKALWLIGELNANDEPRIGHPEELRERDQKLATRRAKTPTLRSADFVHAALVPKRQNPCLGGRIWAFSAGWRENSSRTVAAA
jgi:hypothetical protein